MYSEIKTNDPSELHRVFDEAINKGQQAMLTLSKDRDFWSLSINDSIESSEAPEPT
jgi:hypothetical protein